MRYIFGFLAVITGFAAVYLTWQDLNNTFSASKTLGKLWYSAHPVSLQNTEAIISRYIDPCGLVVSLDCPPFLWHPAISNVLNWPAALVFFLLLFIFSLLTRLTSYRRYRKRRKSSQLRRSGEK